MTAHIRRIDGRLMLALDEATVADLSLHEGDRFDVEVRGGEVVLRPSLDHQERLARGRAFIERYKETFDALAK